MSLTQMKFRFESFDVVLKQKSFNLKWKIESFNLNACQCYVFYGQI